MRVDRLRILGALDETDGDWHSLNRERKKGEMDHLSGPASIVMVLSLLAIVLGVVLLVCWIVLPFAVIGLKPLVRDLIREQQATNKLIEAQVRALDAFAIHYAPARPPV